jgi:hypothetical protein
MSMTSSIGAGEARSALTTVDYSREQVIAEIDMPRWYWLGLAAGWIGMGVVSDFGPRWLAYAAAPVFGAVHAALGHKVLSGRRRSPRLSVRRELAGSHVPALVIGFLLGLVGVTIAAGLLIDADGARHPATFAGVIAAVAVACGGPELMAAVRRRALRNSRS